MKFEHVMLDIKTLGITSSAVITQIAAVGFNLNRTTSQSFSINIDINQVNRIIDAATLEWWLKQVEGSNKTIVNFSSSYSLQVALNSLVNYLKELHPNLKELKFWCRGVNFDFVILDNAFKQYNLTSPWSYKNLADVRTFDSLVPNEVYKGTLESHNALNDCYNQIEYVIDSLEYLKNSNLK